jgi:hypothetical protein
VSVNPERFFIKDLTVVLERLFGLYEAREVARVEIHARYEKSFYKSYL